MPANPLFSLPQRSVDFGEPTRNSSQNAWPYFAGFLPWPYRYDSTQQPDGFQAGADADGPDGVLLPTGQAVDFYVPLPRNAAFALEWINYAVHYVRLREDDPTLGARSHLLGQQDLYSVPGTSSEWTAQGQQARPYADYVDVSVWLGSAGDRDYYGGEQFTAQGGFAEVSPVPVTALKGKDDGPGQVTLRALLGGNTTLLIRAVNNYSRPLRMNGVAFGYQVQR